MINPFKRSYTQEEQELFKFLHRFELFADLNEEELQYFTPYMYLREYKQREVVFFRDDPSYALYLIKSGSVGLSIDLKDKMEHLVDVKAFQSFGDNALLPVSKRIYNAIVASETCQIYVIPQANILSIFEKNIVVKAKIYEALSGSYNKYMSNLFKAYKSSFGFFDLGQGYGYGSY